AAAPWGAPKASTSTSAPRAGAAVTSRWTMPRSGRCIGADAMLFHPPVQALPGDPELVGRPLQVAGMVAERLLQQPGFGLFQGHRLQRRARGRGRGLQCQV